MRRRPKHARRRNRGQKPRDRQNGPAQPAALETQGADKPGVSDRSVGGSGSDGAGESGDDAASTASLGSVLGPLPTWAIAAIAGAWAGELAAAIVSGSIGITVAFTATAAGLFICFVTVWRVRSTDRAQPVGAGIGVGTIFAVALVCLGAVMLRIDTTDRGMLPRLAEQGGEVTVTGTVTSEPSPIQTGWQVLLTVDTVDGVATRERAALTLDDESPPLGSRWNARVTARPLPEGGYGDWLARQHAAVMLDVNSWEQAAEPGVLAAASETVRDRVRQAATRHLDDRTGGLLVGLVTGDTRLLPEDDQEAMQRVSLTHLTAVSGAHLAIVLAGVYGLATLLRASVRGRWIAVALVVPWFAFVTRFEPSILRAGTMTMLLLLVGIRGVRPESRHALCGAVLLLVLLDPRLAGSLGLLLSATATAGVLMIAPRVRERLPRRIPKRIADLSSITVGAQIAVVPVILVTFGELELSSIPANMIAVPAAAAAAAISFVSSILALIHVELGAIGFAAAGPGSQIVLQVAHGLAGVGTVIEVARPATVVALLGACMWVLAPQKSRSGRWALIVAVVAFTASWVPSVTGRMPVDAFTVTAIDVGQGDAYLLESPGARVLFDAGEDDQAARWLERNGRSHLDLVVVSHPHLDHVGGVPDVLASVSVDALWAAPLPAELPEIDQMYALAAETDVPVRAPSAGEVAVVGDLQIEVVHPPPGRPYRYARSELNESSYVLRVHGPGGGRVLLTGDIELAAQADLLAGDHTRLNAEVFSVPHHGAGTTDPQFLAAIDGQIGLIGVGEDNRYGHPHPEIMKALNEQGVQVHRTDLDGTVRVPVPTQVPLDATATGQVEIAASLVTDTPVSGTHGGRSAAQRSRIGVYAERTVGEDDAPNAHGACCAARARPVGRAPPGRDRDTHPPAEPDQRTCVRSGRDQHAGARSGRGRDAGVSARHDRNAHAAHAARAVVSCGRVRAVGGPCFAVRVGTCG